MSKDHISKAMQYQLYFLTRFMLIAFVSVFGYSIWEFISRWDTYDTGQRLIGSVFLTLIGGVILSGLLGWAVSRFKSTE